jgi:hypothetical protein
MASPLPRSLFAGQLSRDYAILPGGKLRLDVPGGNLLYAAAGFSVWEAGLPDELQAHPGLLARVGEDYPQEWLDDFVRRGYNIQGIRALPEAIDLRSFYIYTDRNTRLADDPVTHFARLGLPFPKALLGYRAPVLTQDSRTRLGPTSLRQGDIPPDYLEAGSIHLCPLDYLTHSLLPAILRQAGFTTVTMDPSPRYMNPIFWNDIPALVGGLTAFLPSEEEIRSLFYGRSNDLREMAEALAVYGCEMIIIKRGESGQILYDANSRTHWEIPAYPARVFDLTGAGDAFGGGFLASYRRSYDPLEAVLHGNISASLAVEGPGPFYALEALPGLAQARRDALREAVRKL